MVNEYNKMISSHYPQTLTLCSRGQNDSAISDDSAISGDEKLSEDERITVRLSTARRKDSDSTDKDSDRYNEESKTEPVGHLTEIDLDILREADQILIETASSVYVFTVVDPEALSGRLIGGILGNRLVEAYLLPSWVAESSDYKITHKSIKVGVKFIFVIEADKGLQRLTTSAVTSLCHRKKEAAAPMLKAKRKVTFEQVSD